MTESFAYPVGDSLTSHGWTSFSGGTTNALDVAGPGLEFPGYQLPGIGNCARMRSTGQDAYYPLNSNISSGSIYAFFIVNVTSTNNTNGVGDYFLGFLPSTSTTNYTCRVYTRQSVNNPNLFSFGLTKNAISGGAVAWTDSIYALGTNYLLCAKYTFQSGSTTDDLVSLFVFSSAPPSIEPTPVLQNLTSTTTDVNDIGRLALRQGSAAIGADMNIDEIWVGTDWGNTLPVELSSFTSSVNYRDVTLNWSTASELNNSGFEIERSDIRSQTSNVWTKVGNVNGNGTSSSVINYSYTDRGLATGSYSYRLKQIDFNGNFEYFNLNNEVNIGTPSTYALSQNYPNPFNPATTINFDLPTDGNVSLKLYDMSGKEVATLVNEVRSAGYYSV
ncbi:MAG: T9SS type A sorting domain-containing protein, partial [Ignavibacteriae bacterium]|nr:T9SS type A sorting domain-containing protein [Ignavibacteriota bacterium]